MKIPKKLKIMNSEIKVEIDDNLIDDMDRLGSADFRQNKIVLANQKKHNVPDTHMQRVFMHELIHHVFEQIREPELRDNERLVDLMARALTQAFNSMEY